MSAPHENTRNRASRAPSNPARGRGRGFIPHRPNNVLCPFPPGLPRGIVPVSPAASRFVGPNFVQGPQSPAQNFVLVGPPSNQGNLNANAHNFVPSNVIPPSFHPESPQVCGFQAQASQPVDTSEFWSLDDGMTETDNRSLMGNLLKEMQELKVSVEQQLVKQKEEILSIVVEANCQSPEARPPSRQANPPRQSIADSRSTNATQFRDLPVFDGTLNDIHPKDFLRELDLYFSSHNATDRVMINDAGKLLRGSAATWFRVYRNTFFNYDTFVARFLDQFWGIRIQNSIRLSLPSLNERPPDHGNLEFYFLRKVCFMQYLDDPIPPPLIIDSLVNHFPYDVKSAIIQSKAETIEDVQGILRGFDHIGPRPALVPNVRNFQQTQNVKPSDQPKPFKSNYKANCLAQEGDGIVSQTSPNSDDPSLN